MNIPKYLFITLFLLYIVLAGCNKRENDGTLESINAPLPKDHDGRIMTQNDVTPSNEVQNVNYKQIDNTFTTQNRMIIKTGSMSIESDSFNEAEAKIKNISAKYAGYTTNSAATVNVNNKKQGSVTIRVPSDKFDALIADISQTGKVMNQNISGNDVTEEFMDADARLKTQRELESRLLKLLSEKTAKLTDVVEVETKLAGVRENIERIEGRIKFLKDQTAYSTLTVSVYEPSLLVTSTGGGFFYELGESIKKGLEGFTKVTTGIITMVIALIPLIAIAGLIFIVIRRIIKKRKLAAAV